MQQGPPIQLLLKRQQLTLMVWTDQPKRLEDQRVQRVEATPEQIIPHIIANMIVSTRMCLRHRGLVLAV